MSATDTGAEGPAGSAAAASIDEAGLQAWRAMLLAHAAARHAVETDLSYAGHIPLTWYDVLSELTVREAHTAVSTTG